MSLLMKRRLKKISLTAIILFALYWALEVFRLAFGDQSWLSGWVLISLVTLLALYNVRKKLSFSPLGSNRAWLQLHIYTGIGAIFIFLMHINWQLPNGLLEGLLAIIFTLICLSGLIGIWFSRRLTHLLSNQDEQLVYERLPALNNHLRLAVEEMIQTSVDETKSDTLATWYTNKMAKRFGQPRMEYGYLLRRQSQLQIYNEELDHIKRYMNTQELEYAQLMTEFLAQKHKIDTQYTAKHILKSWLFLHIPLSASLLLIMLAHVVLVYGFGAV